MPVCVERLDGLVLDGAGASLALWQRGVGVARLAEGLALVLVVPGLRRELLVARVARKVRRVPRLLHRAHAVLQ